jgi:hypothetical protein
MLIGDIEIFELKIESLLRRIRCLIWLVQTIGDNEVYKNILNTIKIVKEHLSDIKLILHAGNTEYIKSEIIFLTDIYNKQYATFTHLILNS